MVKRTKIDTTSCVARTTYNLLDLVILLVTYYEIVALPFAFRHLKLPEAVQVLGAMVTAGSMILAYFYGYLKHFGDCSIFEDPLNHKLFTVSFPTPFEKYNFAVSHWPFTHFIFCMVLAYCFPSHGYVIFVAGVLWEGVESWMKMVTSKKSENDTSKKAKRVRIDTNTIEYTTYWDSSFKDIVFNTVGLLFGLALREIVMK